MAHTQLVCMSYSAQHLLYQTGSPSALHCLTHASTHTDTYKHAPHTYTHTPHLIVVNGPKLAMLIQEIILWMAVALGKEQIKQGRQPELCVVELVLKEIQHYVMIHLRSTAAL